MASRDLTPAELRALSDAARGLTVRQSAAEWGSSVHTVREQRKWVRRKLGARSMTQAVAIAGREGLL